MDAPKISPSLILPPPPRRVRPKSKGFGGKLLSLVYVLLFVSAVLSLGIVPIRWYVQHSGKPVQVTVTGKSISHSSRHGDSYYVDFNYSFNGTVEDDHQKVEHEEYDRAQEGDTASAKVSTILGHNVCLTELGDVDRETHSWMILTGIWNLAAWVVAGVSVYQVLRTRRLVQDGTAVAGTISNKRFSRGRSSTWYLGYTYSTTDGQPFVREQSVSRSTYGNYEIGTPVNVLYDPAKPKHSVIYEACNYVVES